MSAEPVEPGRRAVRIGITGPIGCGKSTVAGWLGERDGVVVIDADRVAGDVLDPGEPALEAVLARFGRELVQANGSLDRAALGRIVFADSAALADLEAIVHPAVRPRILAAIEAADAAGAAAVVVEAIKLVEGGLAALCDEVWLVTCDPHEQRARLVGRGSSDADADQRLGAQGDIATRLRPFATRVVETSDGATETRRRAESALDAATGRARR
ncbi:MAG: dephospho-CoA kinase [Chloroflexi bacterium]|nr:dephospho-CoA kinase [Chloroflexota bacterium]